jgi:hypothetical protein
VVGVRHAEQSADHQRGHRQREGLDQVDRPRTGEQLVHELVDEPLHVSARMVLDPLDRELRGHHAAHAWSARARPSR